MMSARVSDDAQGELQGALSSASSMAMILSPMTMTATFAYFTRADALIYLPGAPYLLAFCLMVLALLLFIFRRRQHDAASSTT